MNHDKFTTRGREARLWEGLLFLVSVLGPTTHDRPSIPRESRLSSFELSAEDPNSLKATLDPMGSTSSLGVATHLGEWVSRGPKNYGGKVFGLAVDPTNENLVYVAYGGQ